MTFLRLAIPGVLLIDLPRHTDKRGSFVKIFSASALKDVGVDFLPVEHFVSSSRQHVIRGMHYQRPPFQHDKLVHCLTGRVQDVLLDLRPGDGYGDVIAIDLDGDRPQSLFIPEGVAHGFCVRSEAALMLYATNTEHTPSHDAGILWNSIQHDWNCAKPIVSNRDQLHPSLSDFSSPF